MANMPNPGFMKPGNSMGNIPPRGMPPKPGGFPPPRQNSMPPGPIGGVPSQIGALAPTPPPMNSGGSLSAPSGHGVSHGTSAIKLPADPVIEFINQYKKSLMPFIIPNIEPKLLDKGNEEHLRARIEVLVDEKLAADKAPIGRQLRVRLLTEVIDEMVGFGPLEQLLKDDSISEIMVNGAKTIYIEQKGRLTLSSVQFTDEDALRRVIDRILSPLGRRVDESTPLCDARLPDGSRVNVIIPPLALNGGTITIRKFSKSALSMEKLMAFNALSPGMSMFLKAAVHSTLNIVISGGTGSGKTTLLNALSSFIPDGERIITVEDAAELKLQQEHVVRLESRPKNIEGKGEISIRELVKNTLRMRPDRIVIGECRGGEALDMIQAMNTGHDGSMTTTHANDPRSALSRLETLVMMAGMDLPQLAIRQQISGAVHLIVQIGRLADGSRRMLNITEVQGMEGNTVLLQDIFKFEQTGTNAEGKIMGILKGCGLVPKCMDRFKAAGMHVPVEIFSSVVYVNYPEGEEGQ